MGVLGNIDKELYAEGVEEGRKREIRRIKRIINGLPWLLDSLKKDIIYEISIGIPSHPSRV